MPPASRVTDFHACPMISPGPVPHVGGPVVKGDFTCLMSKLPSARLGDMCICAGGPPDTIVKGSATVMVGKMPSARVGDMTAHGGVLVGMTPTVIVGG